MSERLWIDPVTGDWGFNPESKEDKALREIQDQIRAIGCEVCPKCNGDYMRDPYHKCGNCFKGRVKK